MSRERRSSGRREDPSALPAGPLAVPLAVPLAGLRPNEGRLLLVGGREIALFLTAAGPRAVDARCPHAGGPLQDGIVSGTRVTCPLHLRRVDLDTGEVDDCAGRVRCYPARVAGDAVVLDL